MCVGLGCLECLDCVYGLWICWLCREARLVLRATRLVRSVVFFGCFPHGHASRARAERGEGVHPVYCESWLVGLLTCVL